MAGRLGRGEIRLFRFPAPDKERPLPIVTRGSALDCLSRVTVAPIASTIRGVPSEVLPGPEDGMKRPCAVNLHNPVTVPPAGVGRRLAQLTPPRLREVCAALGFALGCDA